MVMAVVPQVVLAAALAAAPLLPPGASALLDELSQGVSAARVGEWTTYQLDGGATGTAYWRLAVVGEEKDAKGRDAFWLELEVGNHPSLNAPLQQMRMLVARGEGLRAGGISRLFVGLGAERPAEVEGEALQRMLPAPRPRPAAQPAGAKGSAVRTGRGSRLATYAGTLEATPVEVLHQGIVVKRMWLSDQVPILHLARLELPGIDYRLEVRDYGLDAKARMALPPPLSPRIRLEPRGETP